MSRTKRANGEGTVFERSDGKWVATLDVTSGRCRRRRVSRVRATERAARAALRDLRSQHEQGVVLERAAAVSLGTWLERWLKAGEWKPTTQRSYTQIVRDYLQPYLGGEPLSTLTVPRLQQWVEHLVEDGKPVASIRYARTVLRSALTEAQRLGHCRDNPARLVTVPRHAKRRTQPFTPAQVDMLLRASPPWLAAWIYVTASLGLRRGEALGLQWDDCDWPTSQIRIVRTVYDDGSWNTPKTDASTRTYLAPPSVWRVLAAHRRRVELEAAAAGTPVAVWIWATRSGGPILPSNLARAFRAAVRRAALPPLRMHGLRSTAITELIGAGRPVTDVSGWVGHADTRTTLGYDAMTPTRHLRTAQTIERALPAPLWTEDSHAEE